MKNKKSNSRGSVVIESAIYLPFIFIALLVVFMYASMLYQQSVLQNATQQVAILCSMQLRDPAFQSLLNNNEYKNITLLDYNKNYPYRYLQKNKINEQQLYDIAEKIVNKSVLSNMSNITIKIEQENYFMTNKYSVLISQEFNSPIDLSLFGLQKKFVIAEKSVVNVVDQAEFIRNSDLAFNIVKKIDSKYSISKTINKMFTKAKSFFND